MSVMAIMKTISIRVGLYRPARWLSMRFRPAQLRSYLNDIHLYQSLLSPGALCFDVGANIGDKSKALLCAGARVVAFEPNPTVLPELRARCSYDKNWTLVMAALGSSASVATLYDRSWHGQTSLISDWEGEVIGIHHVPVVTLDAAIQNFGTPFYCKIDVEGWELEVLKGLSQCIPLLSFEFHLNDKDIAKTKCCLDRLLTLGFRDLNLTPAESTTFYFKEWLSLKEFADWFPGDLNESLPRCPYGDLWVRSTTSDGTA
jgi:FkbM family methyltransferase